MPRARYEEAKSMKHGAYVQIHAVYGEDFVIPSP
jgi:hypothetical protein